MGFQNQTEAGASVKKATGRMETFHNGNYYSAGWRRSNRPSGLQVALLVTVAQLGFLTPGASNHNGRR
jgi:hypothetical protein